MNLSVRYDFFKLYNLKIKWFNKETGEGKKKLIDTRNFDDNITSIVKKISTIQ
jgi:hypothetical protein